MIAFYLQIKLVHIVAVLASGGLFALRGAGALAGHRWPHALAVRATSWTVDTVLLTAALMLLTALRLNPFVVPWLATKLVLLVAYIVLGAFALRRARSRGARAAFYVAALATYGFMLSVARAHHPLGVLQGLAA